MSDGHRELRFFRARRMDLSDGLPGVALGDHLVTAHLDDVLAEVTDPALRARIRAAVNAAPHQLGLVFERQDPDPVRLTRTPITVGATVVFGASPTLHRVTAVTDRTATLVDGLGVERAEPVPALTVARADGTPVGATLTPVSEVRRGNPSSPVHTVINGENLHAMELLVETHAGTVDLIYVDAPYNTLNREWAYDDRYVGEADTYRHSKWLTFMERRLVLARQLLKPSGVLIAAIGDDEHHRLRLLLDQIFGDRNFLSNITWQGSPSSLGKHSSGGVDYMLVYARNRADAAPFRETKPFAAQMVALVEAERVAGRTVTEAQAALKAFIAARKTVMQPGLRSYNTVDERWRVYSTTNMDNGSYRPNLRYPITDPATGRAFASPHNGWKVSEAVTAGLIADGRLTFTGASPRRKNLLAEYLSGLPAPTFAHDRSSATKHVQRILGDKRFPFPKNHEVLMRWIRMAAPADGLILDIFGGSGSTAEAVIRLNAEDGGTRRATLITNNEVSAADDKRLRAAGLRPGDPEYEDRGVFNRVTRPRIETVVTGVRDDGTEYSGGIAANVEFYRLEYMEGAVGTVNRRV